MDNQHASLWDKVKQFQLDAPDATFSFSDRLMRENGWSLEFTHRAIHEYKRFMFLICIAPHPLTPSDEVDQVWHLHLLYTKSYWIRFCKETLQREIHHEPTQGGHSERTKFDDWYSKTLALYQDTFTQTPPIDIWPPPKIRFASNQFQRIDRNEHWIIKKPKFINT